MKRVIACIVCFGWMFQGSSVIDRTTLQYRSNLYGNKTENLDILKTGACQPVSIDGVSYQIEVPAFIGISHDMVSAYVAEKLGQPLDVVWQNLCRDNLWPDGNRDKVLDELLKTKKYPDKFLVAVEALGEKIKKIFVDSVFAFDEKQKTFIGLAVGKRLMVRSTGKEDTQELANAGGNETVSNVEPGVTDISTAMGIVVASYLGTKSLKQRLAITKKIENVTEVLAFPFIPILLQVMVGEQQGGQLITAESDIAKIPVSGVMFTTEAEAKTPGLTHIQTTFGHNEGVVNSLVPVDTWYVGPHNVVYPVVRKKWQRLTPMETGGLVKKSNTYGKGQSFVERQTLTGVDARALKAVADRVEKYYENGMDIEFVFMPESHTIYLVQARPIVFGTKDPHYVADEWLKQFDKNSLLQGSKIGVGRANVLVAHNEADILVADRLADALTNYLNKGTAERAAIVCVVVKEMPAATSHEATTFRAENMSIIQYDDLEKVQAWLRSSTVQIVVDVQRGMLINNVDNKALHIIAGWYEFPMPRQMSVVSRPRGLGDDPFMAQIRAVRRLYLWQGESGNRMRKQVADKIQEPVHVLLEELKTWHAGDDEKALRMLGVTGFALLYKLWRNLPHEEKQSTLFMNFLEKLSRKEKVEDGAWQLLGVNDEMTDQSVIASMLFDNALRCLGEVFSIAPKITEPRDLRMLYPIHFLWALFYQARNEQIVAPYSLADVVGSMQQDIRVLGRSRGVRVTKQELDLLKLADAAFSSATADNWGMFIQAVLKHSGSSGDGNKVVRGLASRIVQIGQLDMLPLWLNVSFEAAIKKNPENMAAVLKDLVKELDASGSFFSQLLDQKRAIDAFDITQFEQPEKFNKLWKDFQVLLAYFMDERFLGVFSEGLKKDSLPQLTALNVMHNIIDVFDKSIKTMKGSTQYSKVDDKVRNFKIMLDLYWDLFEQWVAVVPQGTFKESGASSRGVFDVGAYLVNLRTFKDTSFIGEVQLQASNGFSVITASIASAGQAGRSAPHMLEDYFTLIHQNLLFTLSALMPLVVDVDKINVPPLLRLLQEKLSKGVQSSEDCHKVYLLGFSVEQDMLSFFYNMPLRQHSSAFSLRYDKPNDKTYLDCFFFGRFGEYDVWNKIYSYAGVCQVLFGVKLVSRKKNDCEVQFTWEVNEHTNIDKIIEALGFMTDWEYRKMFLLPYSDFLEKLTEPESLALLLDVLALPFTSKNKLEKLVDDACNRLVEQVKENKLIDQVIKFVVLIDAFEFKKPTKIKDLVALVLPIILKSFDRYGDDGLFMKWFTKTANQDGALLMSFGKKLLADIDTDKPDLNGLAIFLNIACNGWTYSLSRANKQQVNDLVDQLNKKTPDWLARRIVTYESFAGISHSISSWKYADLAIAEKIKILWIKTFGQLAKDIDAGAMVDPRIFSKINDIVFSYDDSKMPLDVVHKSLELMINFFKSAKKLEKLNFVDNVFNCMARYEKLSDYSNNLWLSVLDDVLRMVNGPESINLQDQGTVLSFVYHGISLDVKFPNSKDIQGKAFAVFNAFCDKMEASIATRSQIFSWDIDSFQSHIGWIKRDMIVGDVALDSYNNGMRVFKLYINRFMDELRDSNEFNEALVTIFDKIIQAPEIENPSDLYNAFLARLQRFVKDVPHVDLSQFKFLMKALDDILSYKLSMVIKDESMRLPIKTKCVAFASALFEAFTTHLNLDIVPQQLLFDLVAGYQVEKWQRLFASLKSENIQGSLEALDRYNTLVGLIKRIFWKHFAQGNLSRFCVDCAINSTDFNAAERIDLLTRSLDVMLGRISNRSARGRLEEFRGLDALFNQLTSDVTQEDAQRYSTVMSSIVTAWVTCFDEQIDWNDYSFRAILAILTSAGNVGLKFEDRLMCESVIESIRKVITVLEKRSKEIAPLQPLLKKLEEKIHG